MPTYGRRRFVPQAIRYFLDQDAGPGRLALVVVDDGPEPVGDLLPDDDRIRYVRLERRATIGAKRNLACSLVEADVFVQWDDDDWHGPDRVRLQAADLLAGRADITFLPQAWVLDLRTTGFWANPDPVGAGGTFAFTRSAWERAGGYDDSSIGEDWDFFHRVVAGGGRPLRIEEPESYVYVRHAANSWRHDFGGADGADGPGGDWGRAPTPPFFPASDLGFYAGFAAAAPPVTRTNGTGARPAPAPTGTRPRRVAAATAVPVALVHHANQHLIGDGYVDREDLSEVLEAFAHVFALHLRHEVPFHLHLSATLLEAVAWHAPDFLDWVRVLRDAQLVELIGSTYAQHVMTVASDELNRRQLDEALAVYERLLGVDPAEIRGFWAPERVWDTSVMAPHLTRPALANGGYRYVVLDDRLAFREDRARAEFDATVPPVGEAPSLSIGPFEIADGNGLLAVPISAHLRYRVPPHQPTDWAAIADVLDRAGDASGNPVAVYADDLEKTAGVGPWFDGHWTPASSAAYARFLRWLADQRGARATRLSDHLDAAGPLPTRPVDPGAYYELAHVMGAGEDYRRWWTDPRWSPSRRVLDDAEAALRTDINALEASRNAPSALISEPRLRQLAWKQLMASTYEAAWQVPGPDGAYRPAAWIKATAAHASAVGVIEAAARHAAAVASGTVTAPIARRWDIDGDGRDEVILANEHLFAVITPDWGARLVYLFHIAEGDGVLVVGNPADDWHLQEEPNKHPDAPAAHPGAFADTGAENAPFTIAALTADAESAEARLLSTGPDSRLTGAIKTFRLAPGATHIEAHYSLPDNDLFPSIAFALSPDYLGLLHHGRSLVTPINGPGIRGWTRAGTRVWVRIPERSPVIWEKFAAEISHACPVAVRPYERDFSIHLGVG